MSGKANWLSRELALPLDVHERKGIAQIQRLETCPQSKSRANFFKDRLPRRLSAARRQAGQTGGKGFRIALEMHGLQTAARARLKPHRASGNVKRLREQAQERLIGLAVLRNRAHPHLQNCPAVGQLLEAADFVTGAFGGQANG